MRKNDFSSFLLKKRNQKRFLKLSNETKQKLISAFRAAHPSPLFSDE
jgi:hypothetical protein